MKNKILIAIICVVLVGAIVAGILLIPNCKGNNDSTSNSSSTSAKEQIYNPETRPVVFSIGALDNNFNPFFSTTAYDSSVVGMTQISMLGIDEEGEVSVGEDEACVVLDYNVTMYDEAGNVTTAGDLNGETVYQFVIKNGIKFSDGVELTIKDVLFNLYVYLDPAYTGSSTMYSTDIKGLAAYRQQDDTLADDAEGQNIMSQFYAMANQRLVDIREYCKDKTEVDPSKYETIEQDIEKVKVWFKEELTSDWNGNAGSLESYQEEYSFTEDWQSYFLNAGLISIQTKKNPNGATVRVKDEETGKYLTSLDDDVNTPVEDASPLTGIMEEAYSPNKVTAYATENNCTEEYARECLMRDKAIELVYDAYSGSTSSGIGTVVTYWATASTALEEFAMEEMSKEFGNNSGADGLKVKSISGVKVVGNDEYLGEGDYEGHDILQITINGIDPKAIWNFGFTVAPMHYYSTPELAAAANKVDAFGVKFADKTFFDTVLKDPEKTGVPVGAGVYKASTDNGAAPTRLTFFKNNVVYYERNTYFETVGSGLSNAKIKYLNYKVVGEDKIINALIGQNIDFGDPQATPENIATINEYSEYLGSRNYPTNGYGYVGINPKYVPDIQVRRAIMMAFNPGIIIENYYTEQLASLITRPMSKESWAYPKDATPYYQQAMDTDTIIELVEGAGWFENTNNDKNEDGYLIRVKDGEKLKITFTIAGETTDHPAFDMFMDAKRFLNQCGFDITVKTDIQALRKLATGELQVWAAAWSSSIDPDMYQVYHKDSTATSTNNWNYKGILNAPQGEFETEKGIIDELSTLIEQGRETLNQDERTRIYGQALDLVMQLAVEFPTYQRNDLSVYNTNVIDVTTLNQSPSMYAGVTDELWNINYN